VQLPISDYPHKVDTDSPTQNVPRGISVSAGFVASYHTAFTLFTPRAESEDCVIRCLFTTHSNFHVRSIAENPGLLKDVFAEGAQGGDDESEHGLLRVSRLVGPGLHRCERGLPPSESLPIRTC
jgi:hypothetical protein